MKKLAVNEIFGPTIQGEGPTAGKPTYFLRLAGCNLNCSWCDTPYAWDFTKHDKSKEVKLMEVSEVWHALSKARRIVVTGGEPLLQEEALYDLMTRYSWKNCIFELETNGTILPKHGILGQFQHINCSPKLSNSGISISKRIVPQALTNLQNYPTIFKFVVASERDAREAIALTRKLGLTGIYLMPEGSTREEQIKNSPKVVDLCVKYHLNFSPRLHTWIWDKKRKV